MRIADQAGLLGGPIAWPPFLAALLREHLARHRRGFVFPAPSGTWLWRSTFLRRVSARRSRAATRPG
ncbi:hypothetical protein OHS58_44935 [Amycolatopsis sp. NBC_00348]|uniref:hypothetical protein n=1 Tax=Amycolatopsis sp. NBC_00348 TaxID=2975956 RepID=UPI002E2601B2